MGLPLSYLHVGGGNWLGLQPGPPTHVPAPGGRGAGEIVAIHHTALCELREVKRRQRAGEEGELKDINQVQPRERDELVWHGAREEGVVQTKNIVTFLSR